MLSTTKKGFLAALGREIVYFFGGFTGVGLQLRNQGVTEYRIKGDLCT